VTVKHPASPGASPAEASPRTTRLAVSARRAARVAGLGSFDTPTLEGVERRRLQLWLLHFLLLLALAGALVTVLSWPIATVPQGSHLHLLRFALTILIALFCAYVFEKELQLRQLARLLVEERVITAALRSRLTEVDALLRAARAVNTVVELEEVLDTIIASALELLGGRDGSIMLLQGENTLRTVCARGGGAARGAIVRFGEGIAGRVAETREAVLVSGVLDPSRWAPATEGPPAPGSAICAPLIHRATLLGVINVNALATRTFTEHDLRALAVFAEQAAGAIANARLYEEQTLLASQSLFQSLHDTLTRLPNRLLFLDRVHHALTRRQPSAHRKLALLFLDLDDFKRINDSLGHAAGDEILVAFAERLRRCVRAADTVARFGGDEFAILLEDCAGRDEVTHTAERILASLAEPFTVAGRQTWQRVSIGAAEHEGGPPSAHDLLRQADLALGAAKRQGKGGFVFYEPAMLAEAVRHLDFESELSEALAAGHFAVHYQPIVELDTGAVVAVEALVRWNAPARGLLEASAFLQHAERLGMLSTIDRWVLPQVLRTARALNHHAVRPLALHVNVSAARLAEGDLAESCMRLLQEHGIAADRLVLELTERNVVELTPTLGDTLRRLKEAGVRIALDDFGTGYSSLSHLRQFPVDVIKIDRSFVEGLRADTGAAALVSSIVRLGEALKITVIAEGIEEKRHVEALLELGCRLGQGWFLTNPLHYDALVNLLLCRG